MISRKKKKMLQIPKKKRISPKKEIVLSYLVGLAPLGQPFVVENFVQKDLQISRLNLAQFIRRLAEMGAIAQATLRKGSSPQTIRVLKRPEDFEFWDYAANRTHGPNYLKNKAKKARNNG